MTTFGELRKDWEDILDLACKLNLKVNGEVNTKIRDCENCMLSRKCAVREGI